MREPLSSLLESYNSVSIKQETLTLTNEVSFRDRFVQVMERVQGDSMITKDLVLQLMQLFYKSNQLFLQLFETSFLLIFKTYCNEGAKFNRYSSQLIIQKYSQFLKLFLIQMIKMQLQVQKSIQEQQYFENFVDFYLMFFAQGLMSSKSFIKEFSFKILMVSFKIIDDVLDMELLPDTEEKLLESCLYLLGSAFEDYKMMGVDLYAILRRIKITSLQVQKFLLQIIENTRNYELRKAVILQGLSLGSNQILDRLLNRLRDKNPFIRQAVIQKLIHQNILFQGLQCEQRMKIFIDGVGSHHVNVRHKAIELVGGTLMRFLNSNKVVESQQNEIQISGMERFLRLFNSDNFSTKNQPIFSFVLESVSLICLNIPPQLIKAQIQSIVYKISDLTITYEESGFMLSFLRQIAAQRPNKEVKSVSANKLILRKFITLSDFLPQFPPIISKIRKALRQEKSWRYLQKFAIILKTLQVLIQKFDVIDCAGKKQFYEQVRKFIIEFEYISRDEKIQHESKEQDGKSGDMQLLEFELRKLNGLLNGNNRQKSQFLPVITHPLDLLSVGVEIFINLSQEPSQNDSILQLKMHITQLLISKQLELEHEITTKMLVNTCMQISKSQKSDQETKEIEHLLEIKCQLQKRLLRNKLLSHTKTLKAFTVLSRVLSYKHDHHMLITASQYFDHIKRYLYHHEDENSNNSNNNRHHNDQRLCYNYLPYLLIYYYCRQNHQNYKSFKKLFYYYALEQDNNILRGNVKSMLTKLINLRLLTQLQLHCYDNQNNYQSTINLLVQKLIQTIVICCFDDKSNQVLQLESMFYRELLLRIFNNSNAFINNNTLFILFMLVSLCQHQIQINFLCIRQILITLQKLTLSNQTLIFDSLLISYRCFIFYFYPRIQDSAVKSKINTFITEISRVFLYFFKITANYRSQHSTQQNQHNKILFWRLVKMMNLFQILLQKSQSFQIISIFRLKTVFPCLYELFFNNKQFLSNNISIQQLVFTKNKLQRLLELCKAKQKLQHFKKSESYLLFLSDIDQLNDKVEDEISKHLEDKIHLLEHQQSTNHSPNQDIRTHQRIKFNMIETFEENLNKEVKQQLLEIKSIIEQVKQTNLFQKLFLFWESSRSQSLKNINKTNPEIIDADKINLHQTEVIDENPVTQNISELFDRRGRRKNKTLSKRMNIECFEAKALVKKNRYLIIPYEIVQKAESSSKRMKTYQNTLKRHSLILK